VTLAQPAGAGARSSPTTRRFGYVVAIAVNAGLLYVVNHLLAWDLLAFLTEDFEQVLPIINASLLASIVVNLVHLGYDAAWFKSVTEIALAAIALAAAVRMFQVFPFDFSAYAFNWTTVTRVVLILAMAGMVIAIIAESAKLAAAMVRR
jgi:hypothetical protein